MNEYQSRVALKNRAKDILIGNYGSLILMALLRGLTVMFLNRFFNTLTQGVVSSVAKGNFGSAGPTLTFIFTLGFSFLLSVLISILNVGFSLFFLNLACGKRLSVFSVFHGFQNETGKAFKISAIIVLVDSLISLPSDLLYTVLYRTNSFSHPWVLPLIVILIIGFLIRLPISLGLSQCYFLMLDFPNSSAMEIVKMSFRIMKGHKVRLLVTELSFIPLYILSIFSFGIGLFWVTPYVNMVYTLFFLDIMNPQKNNSSQMNY